MAVLDYKVGGISNAMLNQMLQSDVPEIRKQAQDILNKAAADQENKSSLLQRISDFFGFSQAGAAEPEVFISDKNTPGFQTIANPDGTISIVPRSSNLPFDVGGRLFDQFGTVSNQATQPIVSTGKTIQDNMPTGIMTQTPIDFKRFQGITKKTDIDDDTQDVVERVGNEKTGIAKLAEFLQQYSPVRAGFEILGRALDFKDSPNYMPATIGVGGYTPEELNRMNALGGYYSEPMRAYRRNVNRISNLMQRAAAGKPYSQKNLDRLMNQAGLGNVDTGAMIDSIAKSGNIGYGIGGSGTFSPGRDYSSSPGALAGDMEYGEE